MPQIGATSPTPPWSRLVGPFAGVRDAIELSAQDVNRATRAVNCYTQLPEIGTDLMQRPGVIQRAIPTTIQTTPDWTGPTITLAGNISPDGVFTNLLLIRKTSQTGLTGGFDNFQVGSSSVYYVPVLYTAPSTYALIAGGAGDLFPILDPTTIANRVFVTALGASVIFAQSGAKPTLLTAGVLSNITDLGSDAVYGRPTIYYGKVFFIMNADRSTMKWSEENQPDTGYDATDFDNLWTLRQTSNAGMTALCGTNDALYVFRSNSLTSITGAVNSDFRSAGTLDAISSSIGTTAPDSVCLVEDSVWFLDQFSRPQKLQPGRGLVPLWPNCAQMLKSANGVDLTTSVQFGNWGRYIPETEVVLFRIAFTGGIERLLAFSARTEEFLGQWLTGDDALVEYGGILYDADGRSMLAMVPDAVTRPLNFLTQKSNLAADQQDELDSTTNPLVTVVSPRIQADIDMTLNVDQCTVSGQNLTNASGATLQVSYDGSNTDTTTPITLLNAATARTNEPTRYTHQPNIRGSRWVKVTVNNAADGKRAVVGQIKVSGSQQRIDVTAP